jgi:hypothetical protein
MALALVTSSREHFEELIDEGFRHLSIKPSYSVRTYLVDLLSAFQDTKKLFPPEWTESGEKVQHTLAEMWLKALSSPSPVRIDLLQNLGDRALYVSGVFSESLTRSLVDVDYYCEMGTSAFRVLAEEVKEETKVHTYKKVSEYFLECSDVLYFVAGKVGLRSEANLMRVYERYLRTGSPLAKEALVQSGLWSTQLSRRKANFD